MYVGDKLYSCRAIIWMLSQLVEDVSKGQCRQVVALREELTLRRSSEICSTTGRDLQSPIADDVANCVGSATPGEIYV